MQMLCSNVFKLLAALVLFAVAAGCRKPTAIHVRIVSDFDPATSEPSLHMEMIRVRVYPNNRSGTDPVFDQTFDITEPQQWPVKFWIRPGDDDNRVRIEVEGFHFRSSTNTNGGQQPFLQARAITGFRPGRVIVLRLGLWRGCIGVSCEQNSTCSMLGQCVSAEVNPDDLEEHSPDGGAILPIPPSDAPPSDASLDSSGSRTNCASITIPTGGSCNPSFTQLSSVCTGSGEIVMTSLQDSLYPHFVAWIEGSAVLASFLRADGSLVHDSVQYLRTPRSTAFIGSLQAAPLSDGVVVSWLQAQTMTEPVKVHVTYVRPTTRSAISAEIDPPASLSFPDAGSDSLLVDEPSPRHRVAVDFRGDVRSVAALVICYQHRPGVSPIACGRYNWDIGSLGRFTLTGDIVSFNEPSVWLVAARQSTTTNRDSSSIEVLTASNDSVRRNSFALPVTCGRTDGGSTEILPSSVYAFVDSFSGVPRWNVSGIAATGQPFVGTIDIADADAGTGYLNCTFVRDDTTSGRPSAHTARTSLSLVSSGRYHVVWTTGSQVRVANVADVGGRLTSANAHNLNTLVVPGGLLATPLQFTGRFFLGYVTVPQSEATEGIAGLLSYSCP